MKTYPKKSKLSFERSIAHKKAAAKIKQLLRGLK